MLVSNIYVLISFLTRLTIFRLQKHRGGKEFNALAEWLPAVKLGDIDNTAKTKLVLQVLVNHQERQKSLILNWALDVLELWDLFHGGDN